jgi:hypothetical protein
VTHGPSLFRWLQINWPRTDLPLDSCLFLNSFFYKKLKQLTSAQVSSLSSHTPQFEAWPPSSSFCIVASWPSMKLSMWAREVFGQHLLPVSGKRLQKFHNKKSLMSFRLSRLLPIPVGEEAERVPADHFLCPTAFKVSTSYP